jgi:adaptin ear-binding coat-associated protein 1/2
LLVCLLLVCPFLLAWNIGIAIIPSGKTMNLTADQAGVPNEAAAYLKSLEDPEVVERVRCTLADAHVFKLPPRPTAGGWRGADWDKEVWQGTLKVVERGPLTVVLLLDPKTNAIFAVCPVKDGAVDRCVDSSRYFVLRVENAARKHIFIGLAFNERNDAFDFNTSLEDSRRERLADQEAFNNALLETEPCPPKDYSIKDGEKIHIAVAKVASKKGAVDRNARRNSSGGVAAAGGFLKPSSKDTPRRGSATGK